MTRSRGLTFRDADEAHDYFAQREVDDAAVVNEAFRDILAGRFDSPAVRAVENRHAGTLEDYQRLRDQRSIAERAAYHAGGL